MLEFSLYISFCKNIQVQNQASRMLTLKTPKRQSGKNRIKRFSEYLIPILWWARRSIANQHLSNNIKMTVHPIMGLRIMALILTAIYFITAFHLSLAFHYFWPTLGRSVRFQFFASAGKLCFVLTPKTHLEALLLESSARAGESSHRIERSRGFPLRNCYGTMFSF